MRNTRWSGIPHYGPRRNPAYLARSARLALMFVIGDDTKLVSKWVRAIKTALTPTASGSQGRIGISVTAWPGTDLITGLVQDSLVLPIQKNGNTIQGKGALDILRRATAHRSLSISTGCHPLRQLLRQLSHIRALPAHQKARPVRPFEPS